MKNYLLVGFICFVLGMLAAHYGPGLIQKLQSPAAVTENQGAPVAAPDSSGIAGEAAGKANEGGAVK